MSAQLYFSNSPAVLLDKLSLNLDWSDPFRSPHIATPTPAMKRWVQMRLAEKRGIIANVDFLQLERTLWQRLEALDLEHVVAFRKPARLLDEQGLQLLILGLLRRLPPPVAREYLDKAGAGTGRESVYARRLCQLSRKLAGFFREYEYSRVQEHGYQGLAHQWKLGRDCFLDYLKDSAKSLRLQVETLEHWQKEIYHELFRSGGLRDALGESQGQYQYTLPQYAEMVLGQKRKPADPKREPPGYHLFGLSQISPFHRSLIQRLADKDGLQGRHADFFIYSLNPCAEYWEDALTPGERHRQQENLFRQKKYHSWRQLGEEEKTRICIATERIQAEELLLEENENPLLSQWGKPGRENIQLWCQVTRYDFFEYFCEAETRTLLSTVQDSVLHRRGRLPDEERVPQDDSLQILACPEIHREVETVHQGILDSLFRDPTLRPDDIAVLVPDMNKYRHVIAAVFGRSEEGDPGHIPFNLSDASASSESDYARAVLQLFELARGRFSRRELFALAANPCFRSGLGLDDSILQAWSGWTSKLNIFHGFDEDDKRKRGYAPEALHTWTHGIDRLILGTVMESPDDDDLRHFSQVVPFADGNSPDRESLQAFLMIVEGLYRDLAPLREERKRTWAQWLDILTGVFDRYLSTPEDQPLEGYVETELRRYATELRSMDSLESLAGKGGPADSGATDSDVSETDGVSSAIPMDLILSRLDGLKAGREPYLSGGVNVAGLAALRSLPFKLTYVLGLGEGEFPEEDSASTLDLRQYRRVIGDVEPAARNRYLFLETLICASGRLRLSYVCRDVQQGKTFQMCSVLNELKDYIEDCVLAPDAVSGRRERFLSVPVPLLSRAPSLFRKDAGLPWDPPPNPFREESLLAWLEAEKTRQADFPGILRARRNLSPAREIFPIPLIAAREPAVPASQSLPLDDLRIYLENPVQYGLRKRLGIRDNREEDPMELEDEPFFCPKPKDLDLLQKVIHRRIADGNGGTRESSRRYFLDLYENLALRGLMPGGHYRDLDQDLLWQRAEDMLDGLDGFFQILGKHGNQECIPGLLLGDGSGRGNVNRMKGIPVQRFPAVRLNAAGREIALHGDLPCLFRSEDGRCATVVFLSGTFGPRRLLPAFLFYVAAAASDSALGERLRAAPFTLYYVFKKYAGSRKYEIGNWAPFLMTREEARAYLESLLESVLTGGDFDLLPFDVIVKSLAPHGRLPDHADFAQTLRDELEYAEDAPDWFAPALPESQVLLDPRVPDDAEAKIRARLTAFFNFKPDPGHEG
ncbi:MAG: exodeoxyribonuclease V subunit gamma [Fibrobacterota bacterium]|nr:exodeoxyribonuclease V subunit gamma [Fibrobacterota bacterium]